MDKELKGLNSRDKRDLQQFLKSLGAPFTDTQAEMNKLKKPGPARDKALKEIADVQGKVRAAQSDGVITKGEFLTLHFGEKADPKTPQADLRTIEAVKSFLSRVGVKQTDANVAPVAAQVDEQAAVIAKMMPAFLEKMNKFEARMQGHGVPAGPRP